MRQRFRSVTALCLAGFFCSANVLKAAPPSTGKSSGDSPAPEPYVLDYPKAEAFCPPVRSTFYEVTRTVERVGNRKFAHPLNGGFGFRMKQKVDGKPLIHVGADLGWYRVGEPVYAVANGVVRVSTSPARLVKPNSGQETPAANSGNNSGHYVPWGNLVVIEHCLSDDQHVTTIYGHLGKDRLVKAGDVVRAGQPIGEIGEKAAAINGGYEPHLHFGIRDGRMAQPGRIVFPVAVNGEQQWAKIASIDEKELDLELSGTSQQLPTSLSLNVNGTVLTFPRKGKHFVAPSWMLWSLPSNPDFPLVGYAFSTDGFLDPVAFLRKHKANGRAAARFLPRDQ